MEGLSDGTLAIFSRDYKEGKPENNRFKSQYFLTQYHIKGFSVFEVELEEKPSGMKEVAVGRNICLALSFR